MRTNHQGQRRHPFRVKQAVDMTAPETFTTASKRSLTTGRRPDMTAIWGLRWREYVPNRVKRTYQNAALDASNGRRPRLPGNPFRPASWRLSAVRPTVAVRPEETFPRPRRSGSRAGRCPLPVSGPGVRGVVAVPVLDLRRHVGPEREASLRSRPLCPSLLRQRDPPSLRPVMLSAHPRDCDRRFHET